MATTFLNYKIDKGEANKIGDIFRLRAHGPKSQNANKRYWLRIEKIYKYHKTARIISHEEVDKEGKIKEKIDRGKNKADWVTSIRPTEEEFNEIVLF